MSDPQSNPARGINDASSRNLPDITVADNSRTDQDLLPSLQISDMAKIDASDKSLLKHADLSVRLPPEPDIQYLTQPQQLLSTTMIQLRQVLTSADSALFERIAFGSDLHDQDESLMLLYVSVVCMNNFNVFQHITSRNHNFVVAPDWCRLFSQP